MKVWALIVISKKPDTKRRNFLILWNFQRQNRSTESSTGAKPWNFLWKFDRNKAVELSVEFPWKVPRGLNRGTFCGNSTGNSIECRKNRGTFW